MTVGLEGKGVRTPRAHLESRLGAVGNEVPARWFRGKGWAARTPHAHLESGGVVVGGVGRRSGPSVGLEGRGALSCENPLCSFRADGAVEGVDGRRSPRTFV